MSRTCREKTVERRAGESFLIGDSIEVLVESMKGGRVRLRCWVPGSVTVAPRELVEAVAAENHKATLSRIPGVEDLFEAIEEED
ncbi:MAG: carbon storage regulator [Candidatus Eisenbacteria bacterium]